MKHVTVPAGTGRGFAFVGRQVLLDVGGDEFFIDLLFYHLKLRCYVVIELKGGKFKPEHLGQLGFYLTAVDRQVKGEHDNPTIGLRSARRRTRSWRSTRWATRRSRWRCRIPAARIPAELQTSLPSIEQIERELAGEVLPVENDPGDDLDEQADEQSHQRLPCHPVSITTARHHWHIEQGQRTRHACDAGARTPSAASSIR